MVMGELVQDTEVVVIGAGPGGYAAAFRAADLGKEVTLIDISPRPGGVCLHRGCIPSKALLHLTEIMHDAGHSGHLGLTFEPPTIDLAAVRAWKQDVTNRLADGLVSLCNSRGIQWLRGRAEFESGDTLLLHESEIRRLRFEHAIVATGSHPIALPDTTFKRGGRLMNSTGALALADIPKRLLVVGGGYVGLELGSVYATLGSRVTLVELGDRLLPGVDPDLVRPLSRRLEALFDAIHLNTQVTALDETDAGVSARLTGKDAPEQLTADRILVAIGRKPTTSALGLGNTDVRLDPTGFIQVNNQLQTADPRIFAIGDAIGGVMLAHKATREGKIAAEVIAGLTTAFDARAIPAVVYTDPQIAWCGLTETEAAERGKAVEVHRFPWKASGRALTMDAPDGTTKILAEPGTGRILGVGVTGRGAEGLIGEGVLAVEMGALVEDMALTIHPHPTLSETEAEAAEIFLGSATHVLSK